MSPIINEPCILIRFTLLAVALLPGCSAPALHADMGDDQIRAILDEKIAPGSSLEEVQRGLDALGVGRKYRIDYPPTDARPRVLLTRLFGPGGFWVHTDDDDVEWLDVSFVFTPAQPPPEKLDRTLLFRDKLRYFHGDPIVFPHAPKRRLMYHPNRFPATIPPPVDPVEGGQ